MGPLIWYDSAQVRLWIILNINNNAFHYLGKSQICAGAGDYFRTSKPHSEKLCYSIISYMRDGSRRLLSLKITQPSPPLPPITPMQWKTVSITAHCLPQNVALFLLISNLLGFLRYCARKTASNLSPWYIWQRASEDFWKFKASLDISNYWSAFIRFARFMFWHQLRINHQLKAQHVYRKWSYSTCR